MPVTPNSIVTPQGPKSGGAVCTAANTNYSAPTNILVIATAGANGARLTRASAIPLETVADTQLQLFRDGDGSGTTKRFFRSSRMAAYTMAQTTEAPATDFGYSDDNPLILAAGEKLYAAIGATKQIAFTTEWADY